MTLESFLSLDGKGKYNYLENKVGFKNFNLWQIGAYNSRCYLISFTKLISNQVWDIWVTLFFVPEICSFNDYQLLKLQTKSKSSIEFHKKKTVVSSISYPISGEILGNQTANVKIFIPALEKVIKLHVLLGVYGLTYVTRSY